VSSRRPVRLPVHVSENATVAAQDASRPGATTRAPAEIPQKAPTKLPASTLAKTLSEIAPSAVCPFCIERSSANAHPSTFVASLTISSRNTSRMGLEWETEQAHEPRAPSQSNLPLTRALTNKLCPAGSLDVTVEGKILQLQIKGQSDHL